MDSVDAFASSAEVEPRHPPHWVHAPLSPGSASQEDSLQYGPQSQELGETNCVGE